MRLPQYNERMSSWAIHEGIAEAWKIVSHANSFIEVTQPFKLAKDPSQGGRLDLRAQSSSWRKRWPTSASCSIPSSPKPPVKCASNARLESRAHADLCRPQNGAQAARWPPARPACAALPQTGNRGSSLLLRNAHAWVIPTAPPSRTTFCKRRRRKPPRGGKLSRSPSREPTLGRF